MNERTMHAPTWFLARRAKALGLPAETLRKFAHDYQELVSRTIEKTRCEGCGALLLDLGRDVEEIRPHVVDLDEGISLCHPCAGIEPFEVQP